MTVHTTVIKTGMTKAEFSQYQLSIPNFTAPDGLTHPITLHDSVKVLQDDNIYYPLFLSRGYSEKNQVLLSGRFARDPDADSVPILSGKLRVISAGDNFHGLAQFGHNTVSFGQTLPDSLRSQQPPAPTLIPTPQKAYYLTQARTGMELTADELLPLESSVNSPLHAEPALSEEQEKIIKGMLNRLFVWPENGPLEWGKKHQLIVFASPELEGLAPGLPGRKPKEQQYLTFIQSSKVNHRPLNANTLSEQQALQVTHHNTAPYSVSLRTHPPKEPKYATTVEPWGRFALVEKNEQIIDCPYPINSTRNTNEVSFIDRNTFQSDNKIKADKSVQRMPVTLTLNQHDTADKIDETSGTILTEQPEGQQPIIEEFDYLQQSSPPASSMDTSDATTISQSGEGLADKLQAMEIVTFNSEPRVLDAQSAAVTEQQQDVIKRSRRRHCRIHDDKHNKLVPCNYNVTNVAEYREHLNTSHVRILKQPKGYTIFCPNCTNPISNLRSGPKQAQP